MNLWSKFAFGMELDSSNDAYDFNRNIRQVIDGILGNKNLNIKMKIIF